MESNIITNLIVKFVLIVAMVISLIVWAIAGFIIYIPLLFRMMSYYCSMVIASSFYKIDLIYVEKRLEYAAHLYPDRFKKIVDSFQSEYKEDEQNDSIEPISWKEFFRKAFIELLWTMIFWTSIYLLFIN